MKGLQARSSHFDRMLINHRLLLRSLNPFIFLGKQGHHEDNLLVMHAKTKIIKSWLNRGLLNAEFCVRSPKLTHIICQKG